MKENLLVLLHSQDFGKRLDPWTTARQVLGPCFDSISGSRGRFPYSTSTVSEGCPGLSNPLKLSVWNHHDLDQGGTRTLSPTLHFPAASTLMLVICRKSSQARSLLLDSGLRRAQMTMCP
jgi:hypothetical protein